MKKNDDKPWLGTIRRESGLVELVCKHGVGHPAYGSVDYMGDETYAIHGCCGCCNDVQWKLADARQGVEIANRIIKSYELLVKSMKERTESDE